MKKKCLSNNNSTHHIAETKRYKLARLELTVTMSLVLNGVTLTFNNSFSALFFVKRKQFIIFQTNLIFQEIF